MTIVIGIQFLYVGKKPIGCKWLFTVKINSDGSIKINSDGSIAQLQACLVAKD